MREIHQNQELLPASLAAAGVHPEEIDIVLNTHLHFDHCGWNTTLLPDGSVRPTFPNARYFAHAGEVAHGHLQLDRDRVSYLSPNYDPLIASGQMTLLTTERHRLPTPRSSPASPSSSSPATPPTCSPSTSSPPASTPASSATSSPPAHHLDPTWVMGYDLDPVTCIAQRKRLYQRAIPEQWLSSSPTTTTPPPPASPSTTRASPSLSRSDLP